LPWESEEQYKKHCAEFVKVKRPVGDIEYDTVIDMALNRWRRKRIKLMANVAANRHGFGRALMESKMQSWQEIGTFLHDSNIENKQTFDSIVASLVQAIEIGGQLKQKTFDSDEVSRVVQEIADTCTNCCELLESINNKLDLEREFFDQYMPKNLEEIVRVENALDAQFDKICSRLQVMQESRLRRDALVLQNQQAAAIALLGKLGNQEAPENHSPSHGEGAESDALDRHQTDQPTADVGDRPWSHPSPEVDLDADEGEPDERDPLAEFVEEQSH
jgi:hypothetical protein